MNINFNLICNDGWPTNVCKCEPTVGHSPTIESKKEQRIPPRMTATAEKKAKNLFVNRFMHEGPAFAMLWLTIEWKFMQNLENILPNMRSPLSAHSGECSFSRFYNIISVFAFGKHAKWMSVFYQEFYHVSSFLRMAPKPTWFAVLTFTVALDLVELCIDNDAVMLTCLCMRRCGALFGYRTCTMPYHFFVAKKTLVEYSGPKISRNMCWIAHMMR